MKLPNKNPYSFTESESVGYSSHEIRKDPNHPILINIRNEANGMKWPESIYDYEKGVKLFGDMELSKGSTNFSKSGFMVSIEKDDYNLKSKADFKNHIFENRKTVILGIDGSKRTACFDLVAACKAYKCDFFSEGFTSKIDTSNTGIFGDIFYFKDEKSNLVFVDLKKNEIINTFSDSEIDGIIRNSEMDDKLFLIRNPGIGSLRSPLLGHIIKTDLCSIDQNGTVEKVEFDSDIVKNCWKKMDSMSTLNKVNNVITLRYKDDTITKVNDVKTLRYKDDSINGIGTIFINPFTKKFLKADNERNHFMIRNKFIAMDSLESGMIDLYDDSFEKVGTIESFDKSLLTNDLRFDKYNGYLPIITELVSINGNNFPRIKVYGPDFKECLNLVVPIGTMDIKNISFNGEFLVINEWGSSVICDKNGVELLDGNSESHSLGKIDLKIDGDKIIFSNHGHVYVTDKTELFTDVEFEENGIFKVNGKDLYHKKGLDKNNLTNLPELLKGAEKIKDLNNGAIELGGRTYKKKLLKL